MAKKSAKSKGYRKAATKKPFLSKRDIKLVCVVVAILAVCVALLVSYDDGALKVQDGKIADVGENWLIVNGSTGGGRRYYKLGEAGEIEGFTRAAEPMVRDDNLYILRYTPENENAPVESITMSTSGASADRSAEYYHGRMTSLKPGDIRTGKAGDTDYTCFIYQTSRQADEEAAASEPAEGAEAEVSEAEPEPNRFVQVVHAYIDAPHNCSISVTVKASAGSEAEFLTDEQLLDYAAQAIGAIRVEAK